MAPDITSDSVRQEAEVTGEVEKDVAEKTIENLLGIHKTIEVLNPQALATKRPNGVQTGHYLARQKQEQAQVVALTKRGAAAAANAKGEMKAEVDFIQQKGMLVPNMFAPPGMQMKVDVQKNPVKQNEKDDMTANKAFAYPMGVGGVMMNGCFGTGYKKNDPCYQRRQPIPPCAKLMEGCNQVGVGFDGRGEYSSASRRKTVVSRKCSLRKKYHGEMIPDTMNVHGIYDSETTSRTFDKQSSYRKSLQVKAGVSASGFGFQASVEAAYSQSTNSQKQTFLSVIESDVIRYEIFLDAVKPDSLTLPFLRDFLALPKTNFEGSAKAKMQTFIIRWGTHYVKSAKFGGAFRLMKTQEATKSESLTDFSVKAQLSFNSMMFNAGGHFGMSSSEGSSHRNRIPARAPKLSRPTLPLPPPPRLTPPHSPLRPKLRYPITPLSDYRNRIAELGFAAESGAGSSSKESSTHVMIEGGDQKVAAIVADFYTANFKETFSEWLKSVPAYPKAIDFFMGTMSELLNLNFKLLFPFEIDDAADGCFSKNLLTEDGTGRKYYTVSELVEVGNETVPVEEKRYCDDSSIEEFQTSMDQKRLALERAIAVYMEEGPIPTTDFHLDGGKPGCQTEALVVKGGEAGVTHPSWIELINGDTYKIFFDLPEDLDDNIKRDTEAFVTYAENRWSCYAPGSNPHGYDSHVNGGSGDSKNKKVSCFGFVMSYKEESGKLYVTEDDLKASIKLLGDLPRSVVGLIVGRTEFVSPLEHSQSNSGALASIVEAPCTVKWSNSYQIKPAEYGGRCLYFIAASSGDIFVVFSAIPRDKTTWYHIQISYQGVALYKGTKLVKYEGAKSARSLGDSKLFQPYFICIDEDMEKKRTYIKYGIGSDTSEKGLVYMVYMDDSPPLGIQFYSFGSGEKPVEVMDARIIEGGATGEMECSGGTVMNEEGMCVEDCHPECNGCIPKSPGSKLDTECRLCKHVSILDEDGSTKCLAACPAGQKVASNGVTCICERYVIKKADGTTQCVSACPANHKVASDGVTCEPEDIVHKWRPDGRCGSRYTTRIASPGQCDPNSIKYCCSRSGMCGSSDAHCLCSGCVDYRPVVRPDGRCGDNFKGRGGNPGQCDPSSVLPCCSTSGWCGGSDAHCRCSGCADFRPWWRPDAKCGPSNPAPGSSVGKCNPKGPHPCCSPYAWCGVTPAHCTCSGCLDYRNLALKRPAVQSTTGWGGAAAKGVDGNKDQNWSGGSCTHTTNGGNSWWRVDLGFVQAIGNVVVYNRRDCCRERLNGFKVHVGGSTNVYANPVCGGSNTVTTHSTITVNCQGRKGRYVGISLAARNYLTLCEVIVLGA
ncbi:Hypp8046 [Branchiostoma lanceolatum]|uniref:Hypp8046 protein n=1 Tax=Branchiostoma lanceolatum TaxID=7740 RepID=A0A8K0ECF0_BRALA|nr:Hypp8046 [Branchiostoma lanceolatum]